MRTRKVPNNTKRKDSKTSSDSGKRPEKKPAKMGGKELNHWPKDAQKLNAKLDQMVAERTTKLRALNRELSFNTAKLEQKLSEFRQTQKKLNHLASFPEMNPNPVVEVNADGSIEYLNPAAKKLFPDLQDMGHQHEWLVDLKTIGTFLKDQKRTPYVREIKIDGNWYHQSFHLTPGVDRIRIYGLNITESKGMEEGLSQSEQRERQRATEFEALLEAVPAWVWVAHDPDCLHITGNRAADELLRLPRGAEASLTAPETKRPKHFKAFKDGREMANDELPVQQAARGVAVHDFEYGVVFTDGTTRYMLGNATPLRDEQGQPRGSVAAFVDITERKRAEAALRESEERFRAVFESSSDCILVWDREYNYLYANQAAIDHVGTTQDKVIGKNMRDGLGHIPDFMYLWMQRVDRAFATGEPFRVEDVVPVGDQLVHSESQVSPIRDATGQVFAVGVVYRDVTERKQMEEELRRSRDELEIRVKQRTAELARVNELLERMFSSIDISVAYMDKDFNFIRVNRAFAESDERTPEFYIGKNHFVLFPNEENEQIFRKVVETGEPYSVYAKPFEYAEHPERGVTHWDWSLQPINEPDGSVGGVVLSLVNVTDRIRAQKAVEAERQRFNDVLEMLPAYLVLLAPDYHVPFANRFFRERFGESHGQRCFEYLFGRGEPCETCESYTALKTKAPHQWEWTGPDGRKYDVFDFPFTDTDGSTLILEMGIDITERMRAEEASRQAGLYARSLIEASLDPLVTISVDGKVMDVNKATEFVTGVSREDLIGTDFSNYFTEPEKAQQGYRQVFSEGFVKDYPLAIRHTAGRVTDVLYHATVYKNEVGEIQGVFAAARDITVRKGLQRRIEATNALLNLFIRMPSRKEYLDAALELIQNWSSCRCAGIRVLNEKDFIPYESYRGFSSQFWESENLLSVKYDQCACIRVVTGNPDPQDHLRITPAGSFWCNNTFEFVGNLSEEEKARFRGVCVKNGFKSVAIIPIRYREKILGAIHLADEREGIVPLTSIEFIESMAPLIGEAINRFNLEEELRESESRLRLLSSELLTVQEAERKRIAREIHDSIGQILAAIKFGLESKLSQMGGGTAPSGVSIENIISLTQNGIEESRRIQMDLRPSVLDDLGILATIGWFTREFQKVYVHISVEKQISVEENEIPNSLRTVLFRVMQEAMNNVAKHSKANLIRLSLKKVDDRIELCIEDNGAGFDPETIKKGLGLTSMRERTDLSGGSFEIESVPGKGTIIRAQWPI